MRNLVARPNWKLDIPTQKLLIPLANWSFQVASVLTLDEEEINANARELAPIVWKRNIAQF